MSASSNPSYRIVDRSGRPILDDTDRQIRGSTEEEAIKAFDLTFYMPFSRMSQRLGYRVEREP